MPVSVSVSILMKAYASVLYVSECLRLTLYLSLLLLYVCLCICACLLMPTPPLYESVSVTFHSVSVCP
jgi:hypothetical protein